MMRKDEFGSPLAINMMIDKDLTYVACICCLREAIDYLLRDDVETIRRWNKGNLLESNCSSKIQPVNHISTLLAPSRNNHSELF